ncbi:uncharacterized protein LOC124155775 [Ischnura elegans]|uniref:uncharacterized protein LOC124155775 n=1 Tax=Ischnura elegans TaxID=197161 RepID=UPI001ED8A552|nr:uncharacterized protein LOC124155775 [Ischnura elegans]
MKKNFNTSHHGVSESVIGQSRWSTITLSNSPELLPLPPAPSMRSAATGVTHRRRSFEESSACRRLLPEGREKTAIAFSCIGCCSRGEMSEKKDPWSGAKKKHETERPRSASSPNNSSCGRGVDGMRRLQSLAFNGSASSLFANWGFDTNGNNSSSTPNEGMVNHSPFQQQTSGGIPPKKNQQKWNPPAVSSPRAQAPPEIQRRLFSPTDASAPSCLETDPAHTTRGGQSIVGNGWNVSASNTGRGYNASSSLQLQNPIGHPNHLKNSSSTALSQGKKMGVRLFNSRPGGRNYPAHTRSATYSQAGSSLPSVTSASMTPVNLDRYRAQDTNYGFPPSNAGNIQLFLGSFHLPPPQYGISYNITIHNYFLPLSSHHQVFYYTLYSNIAHQSQYPQHSQVWNYPPPNVSQGYWNPGSIQNGGDQQIYYLDSFMTPSRLYSQDMRVHPGNQFSPSTTTSYGTTDSTSSFGVNNFAGGLTHSEPLNPTSTWGPPSVSTHNWSNDGFASQHAGAVDQPLDLSSYPEINEGALGFSYFTDDSLSSIPEVVTHLADPTALEGASNQEEKETAVTDPVKDVDLNSNVNVNTDACEDNSGHLQAVKDEDNGHQPDGSGGSDSKEGN